MMRNCYMTGQKLACRLKFNGEIGLFLFIILYIVRFVKNSPLFVDAIKGAP